MAIYTVWTDYTDETHAREQFETLAEAVAFAHYETEWESTIESRLYKDIELLQTYKGAFAK
jgi:hypothetical protein